MPNLSLPRRKPVPRRSGMIMYFVLFVTISLGVLIVSFHKSARHFGFSSYQFEQSEVVQELSRMAIREAFEVVARDLVDPESDTAKWLVQATRDWQGAGAAPRDVPLTITRNLAGSMVRSYLTPEIGCRLDLFDVRRRGRTIPTFYGREAVGTLQFSVEATLRDSRGSSVAACQLTRHHDFKIANLVSQATRKTYASGFPLDYALLVRNGSREFRESQHGSMLNNKDIRIVVSQPDDATRRGRVFFGGSPEQPVFLNLSSEFRDLIPALPPGKVIETISYDEIVKLFPEVDKKVHEEAEAAAEKAKTPFGGGPSAGEIYEKIVAKLRRDLHGEFSASTHPIYGAAGDGREQRAQTAMSGVRDTLAATLGQNSPLVSLSPGLELIDPALAARTADVDSVFSGGIHQRFFYFVEFNLKGESDVKIDRKQNVPCTRMPVPRPENAAQATFFAELEKLDASRGGKLPLMSQFVSVFPFKPQPALAPPLDENDTAPNPGFPAPVFFNVTGTKVQAENAGAQGFYPFRNRILFQRYLDDPEKLKTFGYLEPAQDGRRETLHLNGTIGIFPPDNRPVVLGSDPSQPLEIDGAGVLVSKNGFTINSAIKKRDPKKSLLVLVADGGPILVNTSKEIEAVLIATNDTVQPVGSNRLRLRGGLIARDLRTSSWPKGEHLIDYDPAARACSDEEERYAFTLSPWVTFFRTTEDRNE